MYNNSTSVTVVRLPKNLCLGPASCRWTEANNPSPIINNLPEPTGSAEEEVFTQVQAPARPHTVPGSAQLQAAPDHHLGLPVDYAWHKLLSVPDDLRQFDGVAGTEIKQQVVGVNRPLICADKPQYFWVLHIQCSSRVSPEKTATDGGLQLASQKES